MAAFLTLLVGKIWRSSLWEVVPRPTGCGQPPGPWPLPTAPSGHPPPNWLPWPRCPLTNQNSRGLPSANERAWSLASWQLDQWESLIAGLWQQLLTGLAAPRGWNPAQPGWTNLPVPPTHETALPTFFLSKLSLSWQKDQGHPRKSSKCLIIIKSLWPGGQMARNALFTRYAQFCPICLFLPILTVIWKHNQILWALPQMLAARIWPIFPLLLPFASC